MQQKYELWTRLTYFWHKNERKISPNFIFCIRNPTFSTYMSQLFIVKICFTNKINIISGGGQLLVSGSQGSISRVPSIRFFVVESQVARSQLQGPWVPSSRIPSSKSRGPRSGVSGSRVPDIRVPGSDVSGSQGPRSQCPGIPGLRVLGLRSWF